MTDQSPPTATCTMVRRLLSAAVVGFALSSPASFAQAPTPGTAALPATGSAPAPNVDPVDAFSDPRWTGRPQAPSVSRKEAAAALVEGRRRCASERNAQARTECMGIVVADHRLMLSSIDPRSSRRR